MQLEWMMTRGVFIKVPELECKTKQGNPLTLKWVDTLKSDGRHISRLVVREMKKAKAVDEKLVPLAVFSSIAPVECLRMMVSDMMTVERGNGAKAPTERMAFWDVSRAHF